MTLSTRIHASLVPLCCWLAACSGSRGEDESIPVSTQRSLVTVTGAQPVPSDGVSGVLLQVTLRDEAGQPIPGRLLTVDSTGSENVFLPGAAIRTGPDGSASIAMTSTRAEPKTLRIAARSAGAAIELPARPEVVFVPAAVARQRVSVSSTGAEANDFSRDAAVSGNGRYVAFMSKAFNLVRGDTNQKEDVFVHDRSTGVTERVSLRPDGSQFPDLCGSPSLSDDGLLVAFEGRARDTDAVFVRDRIAGITEPISDATGLRGRCFAPRISGDGRFVAFLRNDGESQRVHVYDRLTGGLRLASRSSAGEPANGACERPSISRDGRYVAFASIADNLVPGDSNDKYDIFVHDCTTGRTRRVSVRSDGAEGNDDSVEPAIAADGRFVAFASKAENLVRGDDNGKSDVFVHDMTTGITERVSLDPRGNEVDKESWQPQLSADGAFVVFSSLSDELVAGDRNGKEDVFRRDRATGVTVRVSLARGGGDPDEFSTGPALAADAPVVAFTSKAQNLVPRDDNDKEDIFVAPRD